MKFYVKQAQEKNSSISNDGGHGGSNDAEAGDEEEVEKHIPYGGGQIRRHGDRGHPDGSQIIHYKTVKAEKKNRRAQPDKRRNGRHKGFSIEKSYGGRAKNRGQSQ